MGNFDAIDSRLSKIHGSHIHCVLLVFPTHVLCSVKKTLLFPFELTRFCNHCSKHHDILSTISKNLYLKLWLVRNLAVSSCVSFVFYYFGSVLRV